MRMTTTMVKFSSKITPWSSTVDVEVMHSEPILKERLQIMAYCDLEATIRSSDLHLFSFNLLASIHAPIFSMQASNQCFAENSLDSIRWVQRNVEVCVISIKMDLETMLRGNVSNRTKTYAE